MSLRQYVAPLLFALTFALPACSDQSTEDLVKAAAQGDTAAMRELEKRTVAAVEKGGEQILSMQQHSVDKLKELAEEGTAMAGDAALELSRRAGQGTAEFKKWLERAAEGGALEGKYLLGKYRLHGVAGYAKDAESGRTMLEEAAAGGHAEAAFTLGIAYKYGLEVPEDAAMATTYLQQALDNGFTAAADEL